MIENSTHFSRNIQEDDVLNVHIDVFPSEGNEPLHAPVKVPMRVAMITEGYDHIGTEMVSEWHITLRPMVNHPFFARYNDFINITDSDFTLFNVYESEPLYFDYYLTEDDEMELMQIRSMRSNFVPGKAYVRGERTTSDDLARLEALYDYEIAGRALHGGNGIHLRNRFVNRNQ